MSGPGLYLYVNSFTNKVEVVSFHSDHNPEVGTLVVKEQRGVVDFDSVGQYSTSWVDRGNTGIWTFLGPYEKFHAQNMDGLGKYDDQSAFIAICCAHFEHPNCAEIDAWLSSDTDALPPYKTRWFEDLTAQQLRQFILDEYAKAVRTTQHEGVCDA